MKNRTFSSSVYTLFICLPLVSYVATAEDKDKDIETITVTGSKMSSTLQELPTSASVISKEQIKQARIERLTDIESFVPNLKFSKLGEVGTQFISIRGVGANPLNENRVAVYIDDIPYRKINDKMLMDVSQIEVLRGPQGTLYGANTEGGVIVINTLLPSDELTVSAQLSTEHYDQGNRQRALVKTSGWLNDQWSARLALSHEKGDAYTQNVDPSAANKGEIADSALLATLNYFPSEELAISLQYFAEFNRADGIYEQNYIPINTALYNEVFSQPNEVFAQYYGIAQINAHPIDKRYEYHMDGVRKFDENEHSLNGKVSYDWADYSFISITSYLNKKSYGYGAQVDLTSLPLINSGGIDETRQLFQEFRLHSNGDDDFSWLLGTSAYYGERDFAVHVKDIIGQQQSFSALTPLEETSQDMALFANGVFTLTDDWKITAGARWERAKRKVSREKNGLFMMGGQPAALFPQLNETETYQEFLPKLALTYRVSDDLSSYISAAKGWQPGGINDDAFANEEHRAQQLKYDPETIWNYELGIKGTSLANSLQWSVALFTSQAKNWNEMGFMRNQQGEAVSTAIVINAAELNSQGVELELLWQASTQLNLSAGLGYTDSEYKNFDLGDNISFSGNSAILMPKYSANLVANYQFNDHWSTHVQWSGYGDMYLDLANNAKQEQYHLIDANISWQLSAFRLTLFADNILDEYYFTGQAFPDFSYPVEGLYFSSPGSPRRIGLSISVDF